jgi:hypothetical protein
MPQNFNQQMSDAEPPNMVVEKPVEYYGQELASAGKAVAGLLDGQTAKANAKNAASFSQEVLDVEAGVVRWGNQKEVPRADV